MYTTNAIGAVNSSFGKVTKRGAFPNDYSVFKLLYLRVVELQKNWADRPIANWSLGKQSVALERPPRSPLRQIRVLIFPTYTICLTLPFCTVLNQSHASTIGFSTLLGSIKSLW